MFAKSKRFQDGPKDYIPGPGEYNPFTADELSKHKRYGFLQQTSRFGPDGIDPSGEFYASTEHSLPSLSSETRFSLSSSSTTKTEDARNRRQMSEMAAQFEKYRVAMQKEIDALQLKSRKLETNLQAALSQKESIQSTLLSKEQELAEMRIKNNTLQKTLNRLEKNIEKSPRVMQLQKQLEQTEKDLRSSKEAAERSHQAAVSEQSRLVSTITEKDRTISELQSQIDTQSATITNLNEELESSTSDIARIKQENETVVSQLRTELQAVSEKLTTVLDKIDEKDDKLQKSEATILDLQNQVDSLTTEKTTVEENIQQLIAEHGRHMEAWKAERNELNDEIQRLRTLVQQHAEQIEATQTQLSKERTQAECLRETTKQLEQEIERKTKLSHKLRNQLSVYRTHMTGVMQEMRSQFMLRFQQRDKDLERVTKELAQAKIFINSQAQHLDGLKSELHWISKWNQQLQDLVQALHDDATMQNPTRCKSVSSFHDFQPLRKESLTDSGFFTGPELKDT